VLGGHPLTIAINALVKGAVFQVATHGQLLAVGTADSHEGFGELACVVPVAG
jgi:hypothetical protein